MRAASCLFLAAAAAAAGGDRRSGDPLGTGRSFSTGKARFRGHGGRPERGVDWFVKRAAKRAAREAAAAAAAPARRLPSVAERDMTAARTAGSRLRTGVASNRPPPPP